jgi:hypothetical protein
MIGVDAPIVCLSIYSMMRIGSSEQSIQHIIEETLLKKVNALKPFSSVVGENNKQNSTPQKPGKVTTVLPWDGHN